jgi:urease accessory protein
MTTTTTLSLVPSSTTTGWMAEAKATVLASAPAESGKTAREALGQAVSATAQPASALPPESLRKLLAWLSPAFPVGSYSYSHGLEWAIEDGSVSDGATLAAWLTDILRHGAGHNDAVLFLQAWQAADTGDAGRLRAIAELGATFQPSRERHLESTAQGRAFLAAVQAAYGSDRLTGLAAGIPVDEALPYPVAVALCAAAHDIPAAPALTAMLNSFVANIVSAGVRAIPIGQTDGLKVVAALGTVIDDVTAAAWAASIDDLGGAALRADIASMRHETQYTRLFRS